MSMDDEVKNGPALATLPPPPSVHPGLAAAVHRWRVEALSREHQRILEQKEDLLARCKALALQMNCPVFIVARQSAGKTTLMDRLSAYCR